MNKELFFSTVIFLIIALIMAVSFKSSDIVVEDTVISEDNPPVQDVVYDADIDPEESSVSDDIKSEEEDKRKGYLALIIDDVGYGREDKFKIFERLYGHKITFSIIPGTFNAKKAEEDAINSGFEVMAHLPMQAEGVDNPYEKEIRTDMTHEVLYKRIEELLSEFKHIKGANNHMGSKATADKRTMLTLMTYLKKRNMFFVDSLTTPNSVIKEVAEVLDVDYLARDIFIDNQIEPEYIKGQLEKACRIAKRNWVAVAICHVRKNTVDILENDLQTILDEYGVELINVSELYVNKKNSTWSLDNK